MRTPQLLKNIFLSLAVMIPITCVAIFFWVWWLCIPAEHRYDAKYNWLQDAMIITPLVLVGALFIGGIAWMLFNYIRDKRANAGK